MALFGLFKSREGGVATEEAPVSCSHYLLVPTWAEPGDMGKEDRASGYRCYACSTALTLEEAKELRSRSSSALC